jgi:hypothetical protein
MPSYGYMWVEVDGAKDARVYVDGTLRVDHVPAKLILREGGHEVEVRKDGQRFGKNPRSVQLPAGGPDKPLKLVFAAT